MTVNLQEQPDPTAITVYDINEIFYIVDLSMICFMPQIAAFCAVQKA